MINLSKRLEQANIAFFMLIAFQVEGTLNITWYVTMTPYAMAALFAIGEWVVIRWLSSSEDEDAIDQGAILHLVNGLFCNAGVAESVIYNYCKVSCSEECGKSEECEACEHMRAHEFFRTVDALGARLRTRERLRREEKENV